MTRGGSTGSVNAACGATDEVDAAGSANETLGVE